MKIPGKKIDLDKITRNPLDNSEEIWVKYGIEQKIHDFIQEGRDGTEADKLIEKAGSIQALPHVQEIFKDTAEKEVLNMNLDPFIANRLMKMGAIAERKLKAEMEAKEKLKQQQEQNKGDAINE